MRGLIKTNDPLLMGPDSLGNFKPIIVKSIHRKRLPVKEVGNLIRLKIYSRRCNRFLHGGTDLP